MIAVITGDIVNSRVVNAEMWLKELKHALSFYGKEWKDWEVYRGDSFQLKIEVEKALVAAIRIKSIVKQIKELDVRIAIGIGEIDFEADRVTESNGSAFSLSGECFENLKKSKLQVKSPWRDFDYSINLMLDLAALTMDNWTSISAQFIFIALTYPELNQVELAERLNKKSQGTISEGLKRGGYEEIQKLLVYYLEETTKRCSS